MKNNLVLQKWVPQRTFEGNIGNKKFNDYVTGTFLFFDNNYFGFGPFRTSSLQVANQIDHRKAFALLDIN